MTPRSTVTNELAVQLDTLMRTYVNDIRDQNKLNMLIHRLEAINVTTYKESQHLGKSLYNFYIRDCTPDPKSVYLDALFNETKPIRCGFILTELLSACLNRWFDLWPDANPSTWTPE